VVVLHQDSLRLPLKSLLLAPVRSRILDPTGLSPCWVRNAWPNSNIFSNSFAYFCFQWGLPALSVLEARSLAGTWRWELVVMLWKAPRVSGMLLLIRSPPTWKVLLHLRPQSCPRRRSWRWVHPGDLLGANDGGSARKANPEVRRLRVCSHGACF